MVYYFTLASNPEVICYMGRDKVENEDLIRWGWPEDGWFHVDSLSSAHVYVRLPVGTEFTFAALTEDMIEECCQLVKENSIKGCKLSDVKIVFTPWSNLKKTGDMDVGQIGYHNSSNCHYHTVHKKNSAMLKALEKTRREETKHPHDFRDMRMERDAIIAKRLREEQAEQRMLDEQNRIAQKEAHDSKHFVKLMDDNLMDNNKDNPIDEDDFM